MTPRRLLRCAVYTRKSSEEGLEQSFNSLDAQREACEAYITAHRHEGWTLVRGAYDDGGYSGGSMERPALRRLLADIASGRVDVVVVYKIDRLTRSLADFARMVEVFDRHGASFVAVTQQFNTTSSMGRLTLNVLLSFAQFEREVTGERIRDKIAASKRRGMWMGGPVPLGYDTRDRTLVENPAEAETVRTLFRLYRKHRAVDAVAVEAARLGVRSKRRTQAGRPVGGGKIGRGALYRLLTNPVYVGEVAHKGERHAGAHAGIVPRDLFDEVQAILGQNRREHNAGTRAKDSSLLAGLVVDGAGRRLVATHTSKQGRRYRYYAATTSPPLRLAAQELEQPVLDTLIHWLRSDVTVIGAMREARVEIGDVASLCARAKGLAQQVESDEAGRRALLRQILNRVEVHQDRIVLQLRPAALLPTIGDTASSIEISAPVNLQSGKRGLALVMQGPNASASRQEPAMIALIARGRAWYQELASGKVASFAALAQREGVTGSYVGHLIDLALLAPDVVAAIVEGRQPPTLTAATLKAAAPLPIDWVEQRRVLALGRA